MLNLFIFVLEDFLPNSCSRIQVFEQNTERYERLFVHSFIPRNWHMNERTNEEKWQYKFPWTNEHYSLPIARIPIKINLKNHIFLQSCEHRSKKKLGNFSVYQDWRFVGYVNTDRWNIQDTFISLKEPYWTIVYV